MLGFNLDDCGLLVLSFLVLHDMHSIYTHYIIVITWLFILASAVLRLQYENSYVITYCTLCGPTCYTASSLYGCNVM